MIKRLWRSLKRLRMTIKRLDMYYGNSGGSYEGPVIWTIRLNWLHWAPINTEIASNWESFWVFWGLSLLIRINLGLLNVNLGLLRVILVHLPSFDTLLSTFRGFLYQTLTKSETHLLHLCHIYHPHPFLYHNHYIVGWQWDDLVKNFVWHMSCLFSWDKGFDFVWNFFSCNVVVQHWWGD